VQHHDKPLHRLVSCQARADCAQQNTPAQSCTAACRCNPHEPPPWASLECCGRIQCLQNATLSLKSLPMAFSTCHSVSSISSVLMGTAHCAGMTAQRTFCGAVSARGNWTARTWSSCAASRTPSASRSVTRATLASSR
jgi:hypothetical protein